MTPNKIFNLISKYNLRRTLRRELNPNSSFANEESEAHINYLALRSEQRWGGEWKKNQGANPIDYLRRKL